MSNFNLLKILFNHFNLYQIIVLLLSNVIILVPALIKQIIVFVVYGYHRFIVMRTL